MKQLKTRLLTLAMVGSMLCAVSAPAFAAGTAAVTSAAPSAISVQLDGENVAFTDAAPQVVNQRTFLPFRAVFEAMGANVEYEADTQTVVATRGDKTMRMVLGAKEATVTENGVTTTIPMDVAAFAQDNRTYVPVRFAAQAFGCNVGWDQAKQTVILLDTENLVKDAFPEGQFTLLQKFLDYYQQYYQGNWAVNGTFQGNVTVGSTAMPMSGTMTGVTSEASLFQMAMQLNLDLSQIIDAASTDGASAEDLAQLELLKNLSMGINMRGDLSTGKLYLNMTGTAMTMAGLDPNTWYCMDMNSIMAQSGMGSDFGQMLKLYRTMKLSDLMDYAVNIIPMEDSTAAYGQIKGMVSQMASALKDDAFTQNGNDYTTNLTYTQAGTTMDAALTLHTKADQVVGYSLSCTMDAAQAQAGAAQSVGTMDLTASMDESHHMTMTMKFDADSMMTMDFTMDAQYTATTETPDTQPPAGAAIVNYADLIGGLEQSES